MYNVA